MAATHQAPFPGFQFPNTTQIPNELFDTLMPHLSGGELKVLLYICRRTFGFRKESDSISLTQIAHGITTKAGKVLDQGTGLSKRHVINALKALEKRNIITVTRQVDETGLNEVNTYSLNLGERGAEVGTKSPQGLVNPSAPGVVNSPSPRVVNSSAPTKQREQKKEEQKKDIVVAQELENFGIAKSAITRLSQDYPAAYIREKLEMAKGLVAAGSRLVSQNPAGWLRRAIEENYSPPRASQRHRQRPVKDSKRVYAEAGATAAVAREPHLPKEEPQQARNVSPEAEQRVAPAMGECPQTVPTLNREDVPEKKEAAPASPEHETIWLKTIAQVKAAQPLEDVAARLTGTTLLEITETAARIGSKASFFLLCPDQGAGPWLINYESGNAPTLHWFPHQSLQVVIRGRRPNWPFHQLSSIKRFHQ